MGWSPQGLLHGLSVASSLWPLEFGPLGRCTDRPFSTQAFPALSDDEGETRRFLGRDYCAEGPVGHIIQEGNKENSLISQLGFAIKLRKVQIRVYVRDEG